MNLKCPRCSASSNFIRKAGFFFRKSDSKNIRRHRCAACAKCFSNATFSPCYNQNKRRLNSLIKNALCSGVSMRRIAKLHCISRKTVKRKLEFLAAQARLSQQEWLKNQTSFSDIQFDDLETFEHTKCKPVTVTVFVQNKTRKILGHTVSSIGAKGLLARTSVKKYGRRKNNSSKNRLKLFKDLKPFINEEAFIHSDEHPHYLKSLREVFPRATHKNFKSIKGCVTGQGELKKTRYDPLFSINHTLAMFRANINRLFRRTWCTTKKMSALDDHISIYVDFHNQVLTA